MQISYRKINPYTVPYSLSNIGSALLAIDLVRNSGWLKNFKGIYRLIKLPKVFRGGWDQITQYQQLVQQAIFAY